MLIIGFTLIPLILATKEALEQEGYELGSIGLAEDPTHENKGVIVVRGQPTSGFDLVGRSITLEFTWFSHVPQYGFWQVICELKGSSQRVPMSRKATCEAHDSNLADEVRKMVTQVLKG